MRGFFTRFIHAFHSNKESTTINISLCGSWRLISYTDFQSEEVKPHWKEVWSFAAMDESETNGVYICDYINLHSVVGKWSLKNNHLKLVRKECENEYILVELPNERLILKPDMEDSKETLVFQRVV